MTMLPNRPITFFTMKIFTSLLANVRLNDQMHTTKLFLLITILFVFYLPAAERIQCPLL